MTRTLEDLFTEVLIVLARRTWRESTRDSMRLNMKVIDNARYVARHLLYTSLDKAGDRVDSVD